MMKIEVGMYIRTDLGEIGKVTSVAEDDTGMNLGQFYNSEPFLRGKETKARHNIVDLIEFGDYVNGLLVTDIHGDRIYVLNSYIDDKNNKSFSYMLSSDIKTVLTHEQFEREAYKV